MPQLKPYTVTVSSVEFVGYDVTGEAFAHSEEEVEELAIKLDIESVWYDIYGSDIKQWQDEEDDTFDDEITSMITINEVEPKDLTELQPENTAVPTLIFEGETVSS